ncbi:response regulator [Candidatus Sumerlaeota bacterium]|nr:response regulator [Candidatus Sumerlaeota bacterium]
MARWRVLAIDDDLDILELVEMTLQHRYDVLSLESGVNALKIVEAFQPDLIILDIMMPKVTGYHIIEELKRDKATSKLPVILLSAKDTIRDQRYGYKLGATTYLTKPFQPERLLRNVDNIFEHTPPNRTPKKWSLEEARNRVRVIEGKDPEPTRDDDSTKKSAAGPLLSSSKTVHHREHVDDDDKKWRG